MGDDVKKVAVVVVVVAVCVIGAAGLLATLLGVFIPRNGDNPINSTMNDTEPMWVIFEKLNTKHSWERVLYK